MARQCITRHRARKQVYQAAAKNPGRKFGVRPIQSSQLAPTFDTVYIDSIRIGTFL